MVSRGQLVEIGGGFRVPDVIAQAGARLVEVGTTNRTRLADYEQAIGESTAAVLRVHQSNFRQLGFVEDVPIEALGELGVPVIDDVGSGALAARDAVGDDEPRRCGRSVAAGAALVCFSGDKLLGGPQAGVIVGRAEAVEAAKRHPLARALRIDKLSLAALEATLRVHRDDSGADPGARDAQRSARGPGRPRPPARGRPSAARSSRASRASAAARCRCSSSPGRSSRFPSPTRRPSAPAIRRCSGGSSREGSCSTRGRSPTRRSTSSPPRSQAQPKGLTP